MCMLATPRIIAMPLPDVLQCARQQQSMIILNLPVTLMLSGGGCLRVPGAAKKGTSGVDSISLEEKAAQGTALGQLALV